MSILQLLRMQIKATEWLWSWIHTLPQWPEDMWEKERAGVCQWCGSMVAVIFTYPLEVMGMLLPPSVTVPISDTELSTNWAEASLGSFHCLKVTLVKEGSCSLFKGLGPVYWKWAPLQSNKLHCLFKFLGQVEWGMWSWLDTRGMIIATVASLSQLQYVTPRELKSLLKAWCEDPWQKANECFWL